jgi:hypothetical protein
MPVFHHQGGNTMTKRCLRAAVSGGLALVLGLFLAGCEGPTGSTGPGGGKGTEPVDVSQYISAALEEKTGGGSDPWTVRVSGIDLNDDAQVAKLFRGVAAGIAGDEPVALDLSGCTGWGFCYNPGLLPADKARIVSITFPASLTEITDGTSGKAAFTGFSALKTVRAPGLAWVGNYAFNGCTALETLDLPEVTGIGNYAFAAASATPNTTLTTLNFPGAKTIGDGAFRYYTAIASISLPKVTGIGNYAFAAVSAAPNTTLTTVSLPKAETIGNYAFQYYTAIATLTLPKVTGIGNYAFAAPAAAPNTALTTLDLTTVTFIGRQAFAYCTGLSTVKLGPTVPDLESYAATYASYGIFLETGSTGTITIRVPAASQSAYDTAGWRSISQGATASGTIPYGTNHKAITISIY